MAGASARRTASANTFQLCWRISPTKSTAFACAGCLRQRRTASCWSSVSSDPRAAEASSPPPEFHLGDFQEPKFVIHRIFAATMDNAVVGLMDPAHVPYVHNQWWWRPPSAGKKLKQKLFVPRERGWAIERHAPSGNSLAYRMLFGGNVTTEISFMLPGFRWEVVENETARLFTLTCLTPRKRKVDAHHASDVLEERAVARCDEANPRSCRSRIPRSRWPHGRSAKRGPALQPIHALDR